MKLTDFMLYNTMVTNVSALVEQIDEQNKSDIAKIEDLRKRAEFLLNFGACPKQLENKIDLVIRQIYSEYFLFQDGKTYLHKNKKTGKEEVSRIYNLVPIIPFVKPRKVITGKLTAGTVAEKLQFLSKVLDSKELAEQTYASLTQKWEDAKLCYQEAKQNDAFANGKIPFFKKKQYEQSREELKNHVSRIIELDTQRDSVESFIKSISEGGFLFNAIREISEEFDRYQQNLPVSVVAKHKSGADLKEQANELEETVTMRNCQPLSEVKGTTILQRYEAGKLPADFAIALVAYSLSEQEFNFLMSDEKLKTVLAEVSQTTKAKTDKEKIEKLVVACLTKLFNVKTSTPSSLGD